MNFEIALTYFDFNKLIFFLISPLLLLKTVVPETRILAPASIAIFAIIKIYSTINFNIKI